MLSTTISLSLLAECFASMAQPRLAAKWNPLFPRSPKPTHADYNASGCYSKEWPWAPDFAPPEENWEGGAGVSANQVIFFACYCSFWALVVVLVKFWPSITKRTSRNAANDRAKPLLTDSNEETNWGETPEYPHDRRVFEQVDDRIQEDPSACAFILPADDGSVRKEISYSQAGALIDEVADALNSIGATTGSVVALCMQRSVAQPVAMFGFEIWCWVFASGRRATKHPQEFPVWRCFCSCSDPHE